MADISSDEQCELTVLGPLARSVIDAIGDRFEVIATRTADTTTVTVHTVDQAAIRALMVMLWDSGHEVLAMSTGSTRPSAAVVVAGACDHHCRHAAHRDPADHSNVCSTVDE